MILIIDLNKKENKLAFNEFVAPIIKAVEGVDTMVKHYTEVDHVDLEQANSIILSGTTLKDNDFLEHLDKFEWIKECDKPMLGICAGMHVIGKVFGCELKKCLEIGMTKVEMVKENRLFDDGLEAYELHGLVMEPNKEFEVLVTSGKCVQAVKHKEKEIYGVLFHPEVRNSEILMRFING